MSVFDRQLIVAPIAKYQELLDACDELEYDWTLDFASTPAVVDGSGSLFCMCMDFAADEDAWQMLDAAEMVDGVFTLIPQDGEAYEEFVLNWKTRLADDHGLVWEEVAQNPMV